MGRSIHNKKSSNRIPITPDVRKAVILEADPIYADNMRGLSAAIKTGAAAPDMFKRVHPNMVMAAFRRAGLGLKESMHLLMA